MLEGFHGLARSYPDASPKWTSRIHGRSRFRSILWHVISQSCSLVALWTESLYNSIIGYRYKAYGSVAEKISITREFAFLLCCDDSFGSII